MGVGEQWTWCLWESHIFSVVSSEGSHLCLFSGKNGKEGPESATGVTREFRTLGYVRRLVVGQEARNGQWGWVYVSAGAHGGGEHTGRGVEVDTGLSTWLRWAKGLAAPQDSR